MVQPVEVSIIEVSPRDGLQNEASFVPTVAKIEFINDLSLSGLRYIEATSFVSSKAIPQLADGKAVLEGIIKPPDVHFSVLVPNEHGMLKAIEAGAKEIAVFTAASESFNQRNIHCSIQESILRFQPVIELARAHNIYVRAYISCVLGCPYEGTITPRQVVDTVSALQRLGVDEISLGDTIGVGTPKQTAALVNAVVHYLPLAQLAMHFHDTYGQAIANIVASLELGVNRFDSAAAGLGGCPYARGASGNVATEDVLYLMHGLGIETGVDIYQVVNAGAKLCALLKRTNQSKVANALLANQNLQCLRT